ncbi:transposase [Muribaculaceae bacterium Isolate-002 (NCI)]|nr:transposase [Muribaculaceae bacterium Isolate-002 (NCI)]
MSQWAEAIDELMSEYPLNLLLELRTIASSVFYYHLKQLMAKDKYAEEKENIRLIFHEHKGRYGYRRITTEMRNRNFVINHKTVQRLMQSMGLKSRIRKIRYRSYKGDVGKIAPYIINRDFTATRGGRCRPADRGWRRSCAGRQTPPVRSYRSETARATGTEPDCSRHRSLRGTGHSF